MPLATAPNAAIPAGLSNRTFDAVPADAKGHAAGVLFVAPDGDVLMMRRSNSEENFAGHWSLPGGKAEDGESPARAAARESAEECGGSLDSASLKLMDRRVTPTGMVFHTFARPVATKFQPKINEEHSGFGWYGLHELPAPLHPGVAATLKDRLGLGEDTVGDMSEEDWTGLRRGLLKWISEEEGEPEHAEDSAIGRVRLALDKDSVRSFDGDGRLHIAETNICKACVSPYRGSEIPEWEELGLDPDKIYQLLRPPEELEKATPTINGIQLMRQHIPVDADDHQPWDVAGAVGTTARWDDPYIKNGLTIWVAEDIEGIESKQKYELSPGYFYKAVMEPGAFNGEPYDGKMVDIKFNHLAIVVEGRQGPSVSIGDSAEEMQWAMLENAIIEAWGNAA